MVRCKLKKKKKDDDKKLQCNMVVAKHKASDIARSQCKKLLLRRLIREI